MNVQSIAVQNLICRKSKALRLNPRFARGQIALRQVRFHTCTKAGCGARVQATPAAAAVRKVAVVPSTRGPAVVPVPVAPAVALVPVAPVQSVMPVARQLVQVPYKGIYQNIVLLYKRVARCYSLTARLSGKSDHLSTEA